MKLLYQLQFKVEKNKDDFIQLILCGEGSGDQNTLTNQELNEIIDHTRPIL